MADSFHERAAQELRRGVLQVAVLALLQRRAYGYDLLRVLTERGLPAEEGTLYPILRRLESEGLLTSEWDTTGMLLFSDDGQFIHRMTSPKHEVPKIYEVTTSTEVTPAQIASLIAGVVLDDSPEPVQALTCAMTASGKLLLTLTSGKYHQVKRMLAAVGNHVESLHRSQIGRLPMPADLAESKWRWLTAEELRLASTK